MSYLEKEKTQQESVIHTSEDESKAISNPFSKVLLTNNSMVKAWEGAREPDGGGQ